MSKRRAFDKVLRDKEFNIAKSPKNDGCQRGLASMFNKLFDWKLSGNAIRNEIMSNQELAEQLHKPIIRKLVKRKVHSSFINNIWSADLANM